jgi:hypothetical protein
VCLAEEATETRAGAHGAQNPYQGVYSGTPRARSAQLKSFPADKVRLDTELSRLGYGYQVEQIQAVDDSVQFVIAVGGVCVTGTLMPNHRNTIEAHGPYREGGCVEPAYGH